MNVFPCDAFPSLGLRAEERLEDVIVDEAFQLGSFGAAVHAQNPGVDPVFCVGGVKVVEVTLLCDLFRKLVVEVPDVCAQPESVLLELESVQSHDCIPRQHLERRRDLNQHAALLLRRLPRGPEVLDLFAEILNFV